MNIFYTGIGSNKTGQHTENEFLNIMNSLFIIFKTWRYEFAKNTKRISLPTSIQRLDFT
jgi:hypothetical protein